MGGGYLIVEIHHPQITRNAFPQSRWNVLAGATVTVQQESDKYPGRGASLWYTDLGQATANIRWYEVSYWQAARAIGQIYPFALANLQKADRAAAAGVSAVYLNGPPAAYRR